MPIDFSQYVDLRPLDVQPADIYLDSISVARTVLPDFSLRVGTPEDAIFQAIAYMTALNVGAINRIPNSLMMGITKMLGTPAHEGTRATLTAEITAISTDGATIPAGTILANEVIQSDQVVQYLFYTDEILVINAVGVDDPLPTGMVSCTSVTIGLVPDVAENQNLIVLSYDQSIYSAKCLVGFANGSSMESTNDFLSRAVTYIESLSRAHATKNQLESFVSTAYPELITRTKVYDLTDSGGLLDVGEADASGYVTIYAYGQNRFLTTGEKESIALDVSNRSIAGLDIGVLNPPILNFYLYASVLYDSSITSEDLSAQIKGNLVEIFNPINCQYSEEKLRKNSALNAIQINSQVVHVEDVVVSWSRLFVLTHAEKINDSVRYFIDTMSGAVNTLRVGQEVTVTGMTPSELNIVSKEITAVDATSFTVAASGVILANDIYYSAGTAEGKFTGWDYTELGSDPFYAKKGSLLRLNEEDIILVLEPYVS
jgi:hypothetical protein